MTARGKGYFDAEIDVQASDTGQYWTVTSTATGDGATFTATVRRVDFELIVRALALMRTRPDIGVEVDIDDMAVRRKQGKDKARLTLRNDYGEETSIVLDPVALDALRRDIEGEYAKVPKQGEEDRCPSPSA